MCLLATIKRRFPLIAFVCMNLVSHIQCVICKRKERTDWRNQVNRSWKNSTYWNTEHIHQFAMQKITTASNDVCQWGKEVEKAVEEDVERVNEAKSAWICVCEKIRYGFGFVIWKSAAIRDCSLVNCITDNLYNAPSKRWNW